MKKLFFLTLLCTAAIFVACEKDDNGSGKPGAEKVFIAGYQRNSANISVATLWIDGTATPLSDGSKDAKANSVYVSGETVYVVGQQNKVATIWKNGIATPLADGSKTTTANSVFVSGNDVYACGTESTTLNGNPAYSTIVWKNETRTTLSNNVKFAEVYSIFVSGNDVYVAGIEKNEGEENSSAVLWKNTEKILLSDGSQPAFAQAVFVSGTDVYIAGQDNRKTKLWKNNKENATILSTATGTSGGPTAKSLFVSGGKAYIGGSDQNIGALWTVVLESNKVTQESFTDADLINSVAVSGTDIYMAGGSSGTPYVAKMWKNGVLTTLSDEIKNASAFSIFVR